MIDPRDSKPTLAVDVVLLTMRNGQLHALLMCRDAEPFAGTWVLPGAHVRTGESLEVAVDGVLHQRAGIDPGNEDVYLEQLFTFGDPARDPRGHIVSVAYYALVPEAAFAAAQPRGPTQLARISMPSGDADASSIAVYDLHGQKLAIGFDHARILAAAVLRLRGKIDYAPVGFDLLPREFTMRELQQVHEAVLGREFDANAFRRKMAASGQLMRSDRRQRGVSHRPALMYRFRRAPRRPVPKVG